MNNLGTPLSKISNKYDAIIIGAGIGSLICGCYLARAGMKVLIVEKNTKGGGCCVSFKRNGFRFDAGAHIFGSCNKGGVLYNLLKRLGIKQRFAQLNPTDRFFFSEDKIVVPQHMNKYILLLQQIFPEERTNIPIFFKDLFNAAIYTKNNHEKYSKTTYQDFLDKYFQDIKLKSVLSALNGFLGTVPKKTSVVSTGAVLSCYLKDGAYYPLGGSSSFSDKIVLCFTRLGGEIIFNSIATKFITKNNRISGIIVSNNRGKTFDLYGDVIISNIDAVQTFSELMSTDLTNNTIKKNINQSVPTPSLFIMYFALKINKHLIEQKTGWYYPEYSVNDGLENFIYVTSPSLYDSSAAKGGIVIIEASRILPSSYFDKINDWRICKKELEKKMLSDLSKFIPEIKDSVVIQESATPKTIENYTLNKKGAFYGWALTPKQYSRNEAMAHALPDNLYLAGHWTNPGGGIVGVAISGYSTAKKILSKQ